MIELIYNQQTPKVTKEVELFPATVTLLEEFKEFAESLTNCIGLSANQVAVDGERLCLKAFVMNVEAGTPEPYWVLMINPIITIEPETHKKICHEGCATWINKTIAVWRYASCSLKYTTIDGRTTEERFEWLRAQIVQHEMDHLYGVREEFTTIFKGKRIPGGRNDLCPCGSGLKYKKCCW